MKEKNDNIIYCGFGVYYDIDSGDSLEKNASGDFKRIDKKAESFLEKEFVKEGMKELNDKKGRR